MLAQGRCTLLLHVHAAAAATAVAGQANCCLAAVAVVLCSTPIAAGGQVQVLQRCYAAGAAVGCAHAFLTALAAAQVGVGSLKCPAQSLS